jgi:cell division protein FtsA
MLDEENKRYAALEITSKAVRLVYGYCLDGVVYVLHALETGVTALDGGIVAEHDVLVNTIKGLINAANEKLGITIKDVVLSIPPLGLAITRDSASTVTIDSSNIIQQLDVNNAISQLRKHRFQDGLKIVDVIPYTYLLDNSLSESDSPLGKKSERLTVHASIYAMQDTIISGYLSAVQAANLNVLQLVVSPYASALYMKDHEEIPSSYYLLDFGSEMTILTQISQQTTIVANTCFKYGSDRITQNLADKLQITFKEAKMLKEKYGIDKNPSFNVKIYKDFTLEDFGNNIKEAVSPLVDALKDQINNWNSTEKRFLPVVITGGGSALYGFKELLEERLSCQIIDFTPDSFGARFKSYQNCLGLIKYADVHLANIERDEFFQTTISRVQPKVQPGKKVASYDIDEEL